jgi:hypothetical protein
MRIHEYTPLIGFNSFMLHSFAREDNTQMAEYFTTDQKSRYGTENGRYPPCISGASARCSERV